MKKLLILTMILLFSIPAYSGCWKLDRHRTLFTGGLEDGTWGGTAAYGDSILYYLDTPVLRDTIHGNVFTGALFFRTTDAAKTFDLFAGYTGENTQYYADSIADGASGYRLTYMRKIVLNDASNIYVAGKSEIIFHSDNAGKTWDVRRVLPKRPEEGVGINWRDLNDFDTDPSGLGVFCFDRSWVPKGNEHIRDSIALTTDGWKTSKWVNVSKPDTSVYLVRVCIPDSNTIFMTGTRHDGLGTPIVLKSSDRGLTWTYKVFNDISAGYLTGIDFINKDTGWVAGYDQIGTIYYCVIYKTIDGGKTWERQMYENTNSFRGIQKIQFANDSVGFALAECGGFAESGYKSDIVAFRTKDGGKNWTRIYQDTLGYKYNSAFDLAVGSPTNAYIIVGWYLFKYDDNCESAGAEEHLPPMPEELNSYPNPIGSNRSGNLELGNTYGENVEGVYLYDSRGMDASDHISYTMTSNGELNFKLASELASGTYIVTVQFGINRVKYCKIIVE